MIPSTDFLINLSLLMLFIVSLVAVSASAFAFSLDFVEKELEKFENERLKVLDEIPKWYIRDYFITHFREDYVEELLNHSEMLTADEVRRLLRKLLGHRSIDAAIESLDDNGFDLLYRMVEKSKKERAMS